MKKRASFSWLYIPLSILVFLSFALFIERSGISYNISEKPESFLAPLPEVNPDSDSEMTERESTCLILSDSTSTFNQGALGTTEDALESMKVPFDSVDVHDFSDINLSTYDTLIITFVKTSLLDEYIDDIFSWVEKSGKLLFTIRPDNTPSFREISPKLGIEYLEEGYIESDGVDFLTPLLPGTSGIKYGLDFMIHFSLPVDIKNSAKLHLISADDQGVPLMWETSFGEGNIILINSDQFIDKSSRGFIGAVYSQLQDIVIFPVINAATFHIDDFPAPVPEGTDDSIFSQFTRDIKSFYLNIWWPDMQELKEKYNLSFTAFAIETYDYRLKPPFLYNGKQEDVFQYFGGLVLRDGGEVALHGYNHVPLCQEKDGKNETLDYPVWESKNDMQTAMIELENFSTEMLPGQPFTSYVPVSNMLCDDARKWLPEILPNLKVIASVYLPDNDVPAYVQEYEEAGDGIIEYPRITAGYNPGNFERWTQANEIFLHYASGHFVHPDDVLDSSRSKGNTWLEMRKTMDEYLLWLYSSMPNVRNLTATEGGMAVQRYSRLIPEYDCRSSECRITLHGFYDQGWLLMRTERKPLTITNGEISEVSEHLYLIQADAAHLLIGFEEQS